MSPTDLYWSAYLTVPQEVGRYPREGIVMDIGCGNGEQLTYLRNAGYRAIGLDLSPEAAHACHKVGHSVIIARAECLPLRSGSCTGRWSFPRPTSE